MALNTDRPPVTTQQLREVVLMGPTGARKGRVAALRRNYRLTAAQERLLDALAAEEVDPPSRKAYQHPAHANAAPGVGDELTAADLVWLQRLPDDPAEVQWEDARRLATMARKITTVRNPNHAALVDAVWRPVADYHDLAAARYEHYNARNAPRATVPAGAPAIAALGDAIRAENETLQQNEAEDRARALLADARAAGDAQREEAIAAAERNIRRLEAEQADRRAPVRTELVH